MLFRGHRETTKAAAVLYFLTQISKNLPNKSFSEIT